MMESPSILTSQNIRAPTGDTCAGAITTTEMDSSLTLGKDLSITDPTTVSVILNGPITSADLLVNHTQTSGGSSKNCSQAPSPRSSYVIPVSPSSPASAVYSKNNQVQIFLLLLSTYHHKVKFIVLVVVISCFEVLQNYFV